MEMEDTEFKQKLRDAIEWQLRSLELKTRNYIEWSLFRHVLQNELVNPVFSAAIEIFKEQEKENKRLKSQFNQSSFQNDPNRDKQIIELYQHGLNNSQIGKTLGMTRQGVGKALKRLNGNSVETC